MEYTDSSADSATIKITACKVWIFGANSTSTGSLMLKFGENEIEFPTSGGTGQSGEKYPLFLGDSNEMSYGERDLTLKGKNGRLILSCIYYYDEPSIQAGYYGKTFVNTLPYSQIVIDDYSNCKQISHCNFNDIDFNYTYLIRISRSDGKVDFTDNTFQYSEISEKNAAPVALKFNGCFTIVRCKFINARTRYTTEGNAILTKFKVDLTIDGCEFTNCGNGHDQRIIMHNDTKASLYIKYSTFKFDNIDNSCLAIDMNSSTIKVENCTFINFIPNVISIKSKSDSRSEYAIFHKNTIVNIKGPFINATDMKISPTITNNTFTNCQLQSPLIIYDHNVDEISLFGNTFSSISNQANLQGGPVCMQFNRQNDQRFSLKFDSCKFSQNTNNAQNINGNGGAFQYGGDHYS